MRSASLPRVWRRLTGWLTGRPPEARWSREMDRFAARTNERLARAEEDLAGLSRSLAEVERRLAERRDRP
ncbi:hypothetical protein HS125_20140 [bacterium]|nr:hypothetical protein [bacterium]